MEKAAIINIKQRNDVIQQIIDIIKKSNNFLFIAYIDPDALGSMLALGLTLKRLKKNVFFYVSKDTNLNVDFLNEIIKYNDINILYTPEEIIKTIKDIDCMFFCDTANRKVIPEYKKLENTFKTFKKDVIEIDHHFGTDADKIIKTSTALFENANATCETIAKILFKLDRDEDIIHQINDTVFKRNVVLSLLTGIISDTQFGKFLINKRQYKAIMNFLSIRLELSTLEKLKNFHTPEQIFKHLSTVSKENENCLEALLEYMEKRKKYYLLDVSSDMSEIENAKEDQACKNANFEDVIDTLANKLPELHGRIGCLILDKLLEGELVNYIKLRRSMKYKKFSLKKLEPHFKEHFKDLYIGGGGHDGAVSFRVKKSGKDDFYERLNKVLINIK